MDPTALSTPAAPLPASGDRPVLAHTTVQPLPKYSVPVAVLVAAALPLILLVLTILVMVSLNYNLLNWME